MFKSQSSLLRNSFAGSLLLSTLCVGLQANAQEGALTPQGPGTQRELTSPNNGAQDQAAAQIVAQTGVVQCPIHLLQAAYDEATSGYQAAARYVTAIEVMHLCREHDELFSEVMDAETELVESFAQLAAARMMIEGAAQTAPLSDDASATVDDAENGALGSIVEEQNVRLDETDAGIDTANSVTAAADEAEADATTAMETSASVAPEEAACVDPRPASAYVMIGSSNSAGGEPRGILGLVDSHNPDGDYYDQSINVSAGDFLAREVEVSEVKVPWSDQPGEASVILTDCEGSLRLTMVSQMPSGHFVNPNITYRNLQTGAVREADTTVLTPGVGE